MIFPLPDLFSWKKAPITWAIVLINYLVLMYTNAIGMGPSLELETLMKKDYFIITQGRVYAQYLADNPSQNPSKFLQDLAKQVRHGEPDRTRMLGHLAFRDLMFLDSADRLTFDGDQVAFRYWRANLKSARELQEQHPSFTHGVSAEDTSVTRWFSYIFVHSGSWHFIGNMLFLVIFGSALEMMIGGLGMAVVFLLSGAVGAGTFALLTGFTSAPLVGASGAVSGIVALFCFLNWTHPTRHVWVLPTSKGFIGWVFLPAWVALFLYVVNDLAGYLATPTELGAVAYTAHLGGETAGLVTGVFLAVFRRWIPLVKKTQPPAKSVPMGVLIPLLPLQVKPRKSA